jgi:hypothetical protein
MAHFDAVGTILAEYRMSAIAIARLKPKRPDLADIVEKLRLFAMNG